VYPRKSQNLTLAASELESFVHEFQGRGLRTHRSSSTSPRGLAGGRTGTGPGETPKWRPFSRETHVVNGGLPAEEAVGISAVTGGLSAEVVELPFEPDGGLSAGAETVKVSRKGVASKSGLMSMTHIDNAQDPHFHPIEVLVANRRRQRMAAVPGVSSLVPLMHARWHYGQQPSRPRERDLHH